MGVLLYATEFLRPLPDEAFQRLLDQLPSTLQSRVRRYRRWEDAHANLLGKILLLGALKAAGYPHTLDPLRSTPQDKPYLPEGPHFNISHSANRVVCLLSAKGRVGIDIEAITPIAFEDFQTQFTPNEWSVILAAPDPVAAFYRFWTAKESLIKADGRGLEIPLLDLDVSEYRSIHLDGATWTFQSLSLFPGYACHITTEEANPEILFEEISPADLAGMF